MKKMMLKTTKLMFSIRSASSLEKALKRRSQRPMQQNLPKKRRNRQEKTIMRMMMVMKRVVIMLTLRKRRRKIRKRKSLPLNNTPQENKIILILSIQEIGLQVIGSKPLIIQSQFLNNFLIASSLKENLWTIQEISIRKGQLMQNIDKKIS